jgi:hypothetical protein
VSEFTLGGYMRQHDRAAAFAGSDAQAYSVAIWVDDEPDERGRYGAALVFVRWAPSGDRPVGHAETPVVAWGRTPDEARERLEAWSLYDVKQALDDAIAARPAGW